MPLTRTLASALLCAGLLASGGARAGADAALEGAGLLKAGRAAEAYEALDRAAAEAWARGPLRIRTASLAAAVGMGVGAYVPHPTGVIDGDKAYVYAQPVSFGHREVGGAFEVELEVDVSIKDLEDDAEFEEERVSSLKLVSRERNREFNLALTLGVADVPDGRYVANFVVHDRVTGQSSPFSVPFAIRRAAGKP